MTMAHLINNYGQPSGFTGESVDPEGWFNSSKWNKLNALLGRGIVMGANEGQGTNPAIFLSELRQEDPYITDVMNRLREPMNQDWYNEMRQQLEYQQGLYNQQYNPQGRY